MPWKCQALNFTRASADLLTICPLRTVKFESRYKHFLLRKCIWKCLKMLAILLRPILFRPQWVNQANANLVIPPLQRSWKGVYWIHLVRLSVCPSVDRIVSALYLKQYSSDPFHICTSYQATSEGVSRVMFVSELKNFGEFLKFVTLSSSDLGSNLTQ